MNIEIYTDASYDPKTKIAIYGELIIDNQNLNQPIYNFSSTIIENTTNTEAEIYGVLNILDKFDPQNYLTIYTDCQMIINLVSCDERKKNKPIYDKFYNLYDKCGDRCKFIKVVGHKNKDLRNNIEENFSKLDKYVRKQLRLHLRNLQSI